MIGNEKKLKTTGLRFCPDIEDTMEWGYVIKKTRRFKALNNCVCPNSRNMNSKKKERENDFFEDDESSKM